MNLYSKRDTYAVIQWFHVTISVQICFYRFDHKSALIDTIEEIPDDHDLVFDAERVEQLVPYIGKLHVEMKYHTCFS